MKASYTEAARPGKGVKAYSGSKIKSPSSTPEENLATIGGMPPIKKIDAIDKENTPKSAPGAVHGV